MTLTYHTPPPVLVSIVKLRKRNLSTTGNTDKFYKTCKEKEFPVRLRYIFMYTGII